jgi:O-antigen/teichoic acid export membrane protein
MADGVLPFHEVTGQPGPLPGAGSAPGWRLPPDSVRARLLRGVTWNILGSLLAQGGSFAGAVVLARILGRQTYGKFALIQATLVALTTVAGLGLGVTATKYVSECRTVQPERAGRILGLSSAVALLAACGFSLAVLFGAPLLAPGAATDPDLAWGLRAGAIYVFFITVNGYQIGALAGLEAFRAIGTISAIYGVICFCLSWSLATLAGLRGAICAQVFAALLLWALHQRAVRRACGAAGIRICWRGLWSERCVLWQFSLPAAASGMIASVALWWANAFLARNAGYAELAVFSAAGTMGTMVLFLPALVARVTTPVLNRLLAEGKVRTYRRTFRATVAANGAGALLLAVVLAQVGARVLRLFGKDFFGPGLLVALLVAAAVCEVVGTNLYQALFAAGKLWWNLGIRMVWASVLASGTLLLVPRRGAVGLAGACLAAWCVSTVLYVSSAWAQHRGVTREAPGR